MVSLIPPNPPLTFGNFITNCAAYVELVSKRLEFVVLKIGRVSLLSMRAGHYALPPVAASDEGFIPDTEDQHLFSPQESLQMMFPPHPYAPPHPSSHPHMAPANMHQQQEVSTVGGVITEGGNTGAVRIPEKKTIRKLPKAKIDNNVSLSERSCTV